MVVNKQLLSEKLDREIKRNGKDELIKDLFRYRFPMKCKLLRGIPESDCSIFGINTCENLRDFLITHSIFIADLHFKDFETFLKPRDSLLYAFYLAAADNDFIPFETLSRVLGEMAPVMLCDDLVTVVDNNGNAIVIKGRSMFLGEMGSRDTLWDDDFIIVNNITNAPVRGSTNQMLKVTKYQLSDALNEQIASRGGKDGFIKYLFRRRQLLKRRLIKNVPELVSPIFDTNACKDLKDWIINYKAGDSQHQFDEFITLLTSHDSLLLAFYLSEFYELLGEGSFAATGPWNTRLQDLLLYGLNESDTRDHDPATIPVKGSTDQFYQLNRNAAITQSGLIRKFIDMINDPEVIPLPHVSDPILPQINYFMENILNFGKGARLLIHLLKDYLARFEGWTTNFLNDNKSNLSLLKKAAHFMDIKSLLYLTSRALGDTEKGRGVEDTSKWFAGFSISPFLPPPPGICKASTSTVEDTFAGLSRLFSSLHIF